MANKASKLTNPVTGFWFRLRSNPIVLKELRGRMRNWRGTFNLALFTAALSFAGIMIYIFDNRNYSYYYNYNYNQNPLPNLGTDVIVAPIPDLYASYSNSERGMWLLFALLVTQLVLITFLSPTFTAGAIAGEKERQTYDILLTTLLRPRDIILGKLVSTQAYLCLMIVAALPVLSVVFLVGGVSLSQLFIGFGVCLLSTLLMGSIALYRSAASRTTARAFRSAFFLVIVLFLVIPGIGFLVESEVRNQYQGGTIYMQYGTSGYLPYVPPKWLQVFTNITYSFNPGLALGLSFNQLNQNSANLFFYTDNTFNLPNRSLSLPMPWLTFTILALILIALFLWLATTRVKPLNLGLKIPKRKNKQKKPGS
jgi:ABC-type transport system involved in multi-copper enzyme maturation permease subunit